jgi:hypothetical protein
LDGKKVQVTAQWIGVAQGSMDPSSMFSPWNGMVEIGASPPGAKKNEGLGQPTYEGAQWALYVDKSASDRAFALQEGAEVRILGRGKVHEVQGYKKLTLLVDRIEEVAK